MKFELSVDSVDLLMNDFDFSTPVGVPYETELDCIFWTSENRQVCAQYFRPADVAEYRPHTHSEYNIVVCLAGEIGVTQLGKTEVIGPGEALISNPGLEHASGYFSRRGQRCEAVNVSLDPKSLAGLTREFNLPGVDGETCPAFTGKQHNEILHGYAKAIKDELHGQRPGHRLIIQTLTTQLLVETLRSWLASDITRVATDSSPRLPRREFVRAYEFMRWCRKENFRLPNLCRFLGSSEERFTRLFLASTHRTPASFYNHLLLDRARELLQDHSCSIKEISFHLGFKSSSHFITAFGREFGASPQEYRSAGRPGIKK